MPTTRIAFALSIAFFAALPCLADTAAVPPQCVGDPIKGDRIALVIGNSAYDQPVSGKKDAIDMTCYLQQVGFTVVALPPDTDIDAERAALTEFGHRIGQATNLKAALFYFSGHGAQYNGVDYFLPLSPSYTKTGLLTLADVFRQLNHAKPETAKIAILDACRTSTITVDGVLPDKPGLTKANFALGRNTMIVYSARFDQAAASGLASENSPYTGFLLSHLREAGLELRDLFNQVATDTTKSAAASPPWSEGAQSLDSPFYFRDQVVINAQIDHADDNLMLLVGGKKVLSGKEPDKAKFGLQARDNQVEVQVYNARIYRNFHTWESAEGWGYNLQFTDSKGNAILPKPWTSSEEVVLKDGPHFGNWFTVARANFYVDPALGTLTVKDPDLDVWKREGGLPDQLNWALLCKISLVPPWLRGGTQTLLLVQGTRSLMGKVSKCFSGAVKTRILASAVATSFRRSSIGFDEVNALGGECAADHLGYALEDHPAGDLAEVPECGN